MTACCGQRLARRWTAVLQRFVSQSGGLDTAPLSGGLGGVSLASDE